MNPQEGIGNTFAPLRRGPVGLIFDAHGIMLNVAPMSTKYLSLVNSSVRKIYYYSNFLLGLIGFMYMHIFKITSTDTDRRHVAGWLIHDQKLYPLLNPDGLRPPLKLPRREP
jgi:hypothetical protein